MQIPKLKPFSPDFDIPREDKPRECDIPGCPDHGEFKAPRNKNQSHQDFFFFCMNHIREYNQNWNYFEGMSKTEMEQQMYSSVLWDRPTWQAGVSATAEERLRRHVHENFDMNDTGFNKTNSSGSEQNQEETDEERLKDKRRFYSTHHLPTPELDALATLGIEPPTNWQTIRSQYKKLLKKHHPDLNLNCKKSEEISKNINHAYTELKSAYQKFEVFEDKT